MRPPRGILQGVANRVLRIMYIMVMFDTYIARLMAADFALLPAVASRRHASSLHLAGGFESMRNSRRLAFLAMGFLGGISILNANAAESLYARLESLDKRFDALIAPDTKIQKIADDLKWSEGPLWDREAQDPALLRHSAQRDHAVERGQGRLDASWSAAATPAPRPSPATNPAPMASRSTCRDA